MEKRTLLEVQKRKPIKRSNKNLLKKLANYLRSNSYMVAPLISPPSKTFRSSAIGVEASEPIKETNKNRLLKKIGEYLKSESYMTFLVHEKGHDMAVSTRKVTMIENEPRYQPSDEVAEDQIAKSFLHETRLSEEQNFGHGETVKHMVYQNCRSTSVSGKKMLNSQVKERRENPKHSFYNNASMQHHGPYMGESMTTNFQSKTTLLSSP